MLGGDGFDKGGFGNGSEKGLRINETAWQFCDAYRPMD
jgi:hypothetical protein